MMVACCAPCVAVKVVVRAAVSLEARHSATSNTAIDPHFHTTGHVTLQVWVVLDCAFHFATHCVYGSQVTAHRQQIVNLMSVA